MDNKTSDSTRPSSTLHRLEDAASRTHLSVGFLRREIARGEIEVVRLGRMVRVSETALLEYLAKRSERSGT